MIYILCLFDTVTKPEKIRLCNSICHLGAIVSTIITFVTTTRTIITNEGDNTSKNNSTVNQKTNGGGASGGHGGNANGGDARTLIFTLH
jgi:hypothetical protein